MELLFLSRERSSCVAGTEEKEERSLEGTKTVNIYPDTLSEY